MIRLLDEKSCLEAEGWRSLRVKPWAFCSSRVDLGHQIAQTAKQKLHHSVKCRAMGMLRRDCV